MASPSSSRSAGPPTDLLPETLRVEALYLDLTSKLDQLNKQYEESEAKSAQAFEDAKREIRLEVHRERKELASQLPPGVSIPAQFEQYLTAKEKDRLSKTSSEHETANAERKGAHEEQLLKYYAIWSKVFSDDNLSSPFPKGQCLPVAYQAIQMDRKPGRAVTGSIPTPPEQMSSAPCPGQRGAPPMQTSRFSQAAHPAENEKAMGPLPSQSSASFPRGARASSSGHAPASQGWSRGPVSVEPRYSHHSQQSVYPSQQGKRQAEDVYGPGEAKRIKTRNAYTADEAVTERRRAAKQPAREMVSFADVFRDGKAEYKHMIVEFPQGSKAFYILKCDQHSVHFGKNPLAGAAKHLNGIQHGHMSKARNLAIEHLGHLVHDCTEDLMYKNNEHVLKAFARGYKPLNVNNLPKSGRLGRGLPVKSPTTPLASTPVHNSLVGMAAHPTHQRGVPSPVPGDLYLAYWAQEKRNYVVMILPLGELRGTGLIELTPKCYVADPKTEQIVGWAPGYEDGGPLYRRREFPVMYFDGRRSVGWFRCKDLSPFDFEDPDRDSIPYFDDALAQYANSKGFVSYAALRASGWEPKPKTAPVTSAHDDVPPDVQSDLSGIYWASPVGTRHTRTSILTTSHHLPTSLQAVGTQVPEARMGISQVSMPERPDERPANVLAESPANTATIPPVSFANSPTNSPVELVAAPSLGGEQEDAVKSGRNEGIDREVEVAGHAQSAAEDAAVADVPQTMEVARVTDKEADLQMIEAGALSPTITPTVEVGDNLDGEKQDDKENTSNGVSPEAASSRELAAAKVDAYKALSISTDKSSMPGEEGGSGQRTSQAPATTIAAATSAAASTTSPASPTLPTASPPAEVTTEPTSAAHADGPTQMASTSVSDDDLLSLGTIVSSRFWRPPIRTQPPSPLPVFNAAHHSNSGPFGLENERARSVPASLPSHPFARSSSLARKSLPSGRPAYHDSPPTRYSAPPTGLGFESPAFEHRWQPGTSQRASSEPRSQPLHTHSSPPAGVHPSLQLAALCMGSNSQSDDERRNVVDQARQIASMQQQVHRRQQEYEQQQNVRQSLQRHLSQPPPSQQQPQHQRYPSQPRLAQTTASHSYKQTYTPTSEMLQRFYHAANQSSTAAQEQRPGISPPGSKSPPIEVTTPAAAALLAASKQQEARASAGAVRQYIDEQSSQSDRRWGLPTPQASNSGSQSMSNSLPHSSSISTIVRHNTLSPLAAAAANSFACSGNGGEVETFGLSLFYMGGVKVYGAPGPNGPYLWLTVDGTANMLRGVVPSTGDMVSVDPMRISHAIVEPPEPNGSVRVLLTLLADRRGGAGLGLAAAADEEQRLVFETVKSGVGRGLENGRIHARRFCGYLKKMNPMMQYTNKSAETLRRTGAMVME